MPAAVRLTDWCSGHDGCPPRQSISASTDVFYNNLGAHRVGDQWEVHCDHSGTQATGSPDVFINGKAQARIGDSINCGSTNATGSPDVFINEATATYVDYFGSLPINPAPKVSLELIQGLPYDPPEPYYTPNILPALPEANVPESHPTNPEQKEDNPKYIDTPPSNCGEMEWVNPIIEADKLMSLGDSAWRETGSNPNIKALWDSIGYKGSQFADHTAWCAVFVSAVLKRSGNKYLKTASSQAYASYGKEVILDNIQPGDILVFYRNGKGSGYGHVGFYAGKKTSTTIAVLGGNQSNSLNIRNFKLNNQAKGWALRTIRRAVSCSTGEEVPNVNYSKDGSGQGGSVT